MIPSLEPEFRHVLLVFVDVLFVLDESVLELLLQVDALAAGLRLRAKRAGNGVASIISWFTIFFYRASLSCPNSPPKLPTSWFLWSTSAQCDHDPFFFHVEDKAELREPDRVIAYL
ncbi:MAG TPA: hypothetical protein PK992_01540 [Planctomycetaceae bacterium]|nr:hypothetical protein [Planctomycetaceae bacterium]